MKKRINYLLIIMLITLVPSIVNADTIKVGLKPNTAAPLFGKDGGITKNSGCSNSSAGSGYKVISGTNTPVYCARFSKGFSGGTYKSCKASQIKEATDYKLLVAGQAVQIVNDKSWSAAKKYIYNVALVNNIIGLSGNCTFSGGDLSTIKSKAKENAKKYNITNKSAFNSMDHTLSSGNMNAMKTAKSYISNKVTFTGLKKDVAGGTPTYNFSVSGISSSNVFLCTGASGTGCTAISSVSLSGVTEKSYYVMAKNVTASTNFSITLSGSVKFSYKSGLLYCQNNMQTLFLLKKLSKTFTDKDTVNLKVVVSPPTTTPPPTTEHQIDLIKVDEYGEGLAGADFTFTFNGANVNVDKTNSSKGIFNFSGSFTDANFYGKQFCYTETKVPDGYVKDNDNLHACYTINNNSDKCYYNGDSSNPREETDNNYCDTNIKYICKKVTTPYKDEVVEVPGEEGEEPTTTVKRVLDTANASSPIYSVYNDEDCQSSDDETTNKVEAERVCGTLSGDNYTYKDNKYCENPNDYERVTISDGNILIRKTNVTNTVKISKLDVVGSEEIPGAELKICTEDSYNKAQNKDECVAAKTVRGTELNWISGVSPMEFDALPIGSYYVIETLPPAGYKVVSTATKFTIDAAGKITTGTTTNVKDNTIVLNNALNSLSVSKISATTSKELSGAKLAICEVTGKYFANDDDNAEYSAGDNSDTTDENSDNAEDGTATDSENIDAPRYNVKDSESLDPNSLDLDASGECIPAKLADGTDAEWSTDGKIRTLSGLPVGTYYLVEKVAPFGYTTAKSILFHMTANGKITDKDGKVISDNKLVMKDEPIKDVKTGILPMIIVGSLGIGAIGGVGYAYHKSTVKNLPRRRKK